MLSMIADEHPLRTRWRVNACLWLPGSGPQPRLQCLSPIAVSNNAGTGCRQGSIDRPCDRTEI
jgi:hypothetical protein